MPVFSVLRRPSKGGFWEDEVRWGSRAKGYQKKIESRKREKSREKGEKKASRCVEDYHTDFEDCHTDFTLPDSLQVTGTHFQVR